MSQQLRIETARIRSAINLASMADLNNQNQELIVLDVVDDTVVANTNSQLTVSALQLDASRWSRVAGELTNRID